MSSNISSSTSSQTPFPSSGFSSSSTLSSAPLPMSSGSLGPFPSPPPSGLPLSSPPSESLSSSSSSSSSSPTLASSSVISSNSTSGISSSTSLTISPSTPGTTLSVSTSAVASNRSTLGPVEIMAIGFGALTGILGIIALVLICCFRPKRQRHHPLNGPKENKSSSSDVESRETPSGRSYFRSLHEQKGTSTPLLNSTSDTSDLSHDELYKDTESSSDVPFPVLIYGSPPRFSSSRVEIPNTASIRPPRSPPPPQSQDNSRPFLSLTIPEFGAPESTIHPSKSQTQGFDYTHVDGDSPSIYSQPSVYVLSRGPSASSHISVRQFSVPPAVFGGTSSDETKTSGLRVPGLSLPNPHGPDSDCQWQNQQPHLNRTSGAGSEDGRTSPAEATLSMRVPGLSLPNPYGPDSDSHRISGLDRQDTTVVASLLKSRQLRLLPTPHSDISHIERAGSIKPAFGGMADVVHEFGFGRRSGEDSGMGGREPYGRRFRRMKAEQANSGMAT